MRGYLHAFPCLLLLLQHSAWAALQVSVPSSPIRAVPRSDLRLPCNFTNPSKSISLSQLAVTWKRDAETVAEYLGKFKPMREGAEMSEERLLAGDASLLLPGLQDMDAGFYTCLVVLTPERAQKSFELKLEAQPHVALGSTELQLASEGTITCTVSGFYPGNISVEWLKDGTVLKGPQTSVHRDSHNGLYSASSTLGLIPDVADAHANFSCQARHQSLKDPLEENFHLQLQAIPSLQIFTGASRNALEVLECLVSGFYPQEVRVHWLRNGVPQLQVESEPQTLPNGTFYKRSMLRPKEMDDGVSYVCRAQCDTWHNPLEMTAHWQLEGEGVPCPTPQRPGTEGTPHSCSPTSVPTSPASPRETFSILTGVVFAVGLLLIIAGVLMLYVTWKRAKKKLFPATESKRHLDPESAECMVKPENEDVPGTTTSM